MLSEALKKSQETRKNIEITLGKKGIPSEKIKSSKFSSTPEYGFFSGKPKNYKVSANIFITLNNEKQFQDVAMLIDSLKETLEYNGIEFKSTVKEDNEMKALEKACEEVSKKKAIFEKSLNVKLVPVSFNETFLGGNENDKIRMNSERQAYMDLYKAKNLLMEEADASGSKFEELKYVKKIVIEFKLIPAGK